MTLSQGIMKKWLLPFVLCFSMVFAFFPQSKAEAATKTISISSSNTYESGSIYVYPGQRVKLYVDNYGSDSVRARAWQMRSTYPYYYYNYQIKYDGSRSGITPWAGWFYFDLSAWPVVKGVGATMTVTTY